jgi:demethylmenaquinone methyltransferase / 2-methoxy-6-polyprenyl-1,4-benzoquinol methylase
VSEREDRQAPHPVLPDYYESDAERQPFVTALFDGAARHYDRVCALMSFGSGQWYRRQALERAGLRRDMKLLDVATGTGLVARSAVRIVGDPRKVIGVDPSRGMLEQARQTLAIPLVQGRLDELPFPDAHFDFLSIGYALRHVGDLAVAFGECRRVLKPGGRLLVLEITRSPSAVTRAVTGFYFQHVLPRIMWATTRSEPARMLTRYYWDTIVACVPPPVILDYLSRSGFVDVRRVVFGGCLSEYVAVKGGA